MQPLANGKFHYLFGDDFLIAPIHEDKLSRSVSLPSGQWRYLFQDDEVIEGSQQITRDFPIDEFPVFVRDGAIVPLKVTRSYTGLGDTNSIGFKTWLVYPNRKSEFTLWHPESHPKPEFTTVSVHSDKSLKIHFTGQREPHILRIFAKAKPSAVALDGQNLSEGDAWHFDPANHRLIVRTQNYKEGSYLISW